MTNITPILKRLSGLALTVFLTSCAITSEPPPPLVEIEIPQQPEPVVVIPVPETAPISELPTAKPVDRTVVPVSPTRIEQTQRSPAVIALLGSAKSAQQQGDFRSAQSALQRAQRIAPRDPEVYYELAIVHRDLEDYRLAEQVALKGVSIVQGQRDQLNRFWLLIADIRMQSGDILSAEKAEATAARYSFD